MPSNDPFLMHATAVAWEGRAAMFIGKSGAGKSSMAVQLLALGCELVADDQCLIERKGTSLLVSAPKTLPSLIEARGVGLLNTSLTGPKKLSLVVDLDRVSSDRLPAERTTDIAGLRTKVIDKIHAVHFPAAILLYLKQKAAV